MSFLELKSLVDQLKSNSDLHKSQEKLQYASTEELFQLNAVMHSKLKDVTTKVEEEMNKTLEKFKLVQIERLEYEAQIQELRAEKEEIAKSQLNLKEIGKSLMNLNINALGPELRSLEILADPNSASDDEDAANGIFFISKPKIILQTDDNVVFEEDSQAQNENRQLKMTITAYEHKLTELLKTIQYYDIKLGNVEAENSKMKDMVEYYTNKEVSPESCINSETLLERHIYLLNSKIIDERKRHQVKIQEYAERMDTTMQALHSQEEREVEMIKEFTEIKEDLEAQISNQSDNILHLEEEIIRLKEQKNEMENNGFQQRESILTEASSLRAQIAILEQRISNETLKHEVNIKAHLDKIYELTKECHRNQDNVLRIADLEKRNTSLLETIQKLEQQDLAERDRKIKFLEEKIEATNMNLQIQQRKFDQLKADTEVSVSQYQVRINDLLKSKADQEETELKLIANIESMHQKMNYLEELSQNSEASKLKLKEFIEKLEKELEISKGDLIALKVDTEKKLDDERMKVQNAKNEGDRLTQTIKKLQMDHQMSKCEDLDIIENLHSKIEQLENELKMTIIKHEATETVKQDLLKQIAKLKNELEEILKEQERLIKVELEYEDLKLQYEKLEAEDNHLRNDLKLLLEKGQSKEKNQELLGAQYLALDAQFKIQEAAMTAFKSQNEELLEANTSMREELENIHKNYRELLDHNKTLAMKLVTEEGASNNLKISKAELEAQNQELIQNTKSLKERVELLQEQLARSKESESMNLTAKVKLGETLRASITERQATEANLKEKIEEMRIQIDEADRNSRRSQLYDGKSRREIDSLRQQLIDQHARFEIQLQSAIDLEGKLVAQISDLERKLEREKSANLALQSSLASRNDQELQAKLQEITNRFEAQQTSTRILEVHLRSQVNELERKLEVEKASNIQLQANLLKQKQVQNERELREAQLRQSDSSKALLQASENQELKEIISSLEHEIKGYKQQLTVNNTERSSLIADLQTKLEFAEANNANLQEQISRQKVAQNELEKRQSYLKQSESSKALLLRSENHELNEQILKLKQEIESYKNAMTKNFEERSVFSSQFNSMRNESESQIQKLQKEILLNDIEKKSLELNSFTEIKALKAKIAELETTKRPPGPDEMMKTNLDLIQKLRNEVIEKEAEKKALELKLTHMQESNQSRQSSIILTSLPPVAESSPPEWQKAVLKPVKTSDLKLLPIIEVPEVPKGAQAIELDGKNGKITVYLINLKTTEGIKRALGRVKDKQKKESNRVSWFKSKKPDETPVPPAPEIEEKPFNKEKRKSFVSMRMAEL